MIGRIMSDSPVLTAPGLTLRTPTDADTVPLLDAILSSVDHLRPWLPWARHDYDTVDAKLWISGELGDVHRFIIFDDADRLVGSCALNTVDSVNRRANLGYWIRADQTGHGHATAATRLLARFGLEEAGFQRLEVVMSVHNEASRRVAEGAGATYEGRARKRLNLHGVEHDAFVFTFVTGDRLD